MPGVCIEGTPIPDRNSTRKTPRRQLSACSAAASVETVEERDHRDEGYARNDASDVRQDRSSPPLGGIHLVIIRPAILEAQR